MELFPAEIYTCAHVPCRHWELAFTRRKYAPAPVRTRKKVAQPKRSLDPYPRQLGPRNQRSHLVRHWAGPIAVDHNEPIAPRYHARHGHARRHPSIILHLSATNLGRHCRHCLILTKASLKAVILEIDWQRKKKTPVYNCAVQPG